MNQRIPHTEPTTNSYAAAYGDECMYDGFGGSAQASHGVAWRHTVSEISSFVAHKRISYEVHEYWCTYKIRKSRRKRGVIFLFCNKNARFFYSLIEKPRNNLNWH